MDRRSVFVGGLPYDMEKDEMVAYFSEVGEVVNVDLIKRTNFDGQSTPISRAEAFHRLTRFIKGPLLGPSALSSSARPMCLIRPSKPS